MAVRLILNADDFGLTRGINRAVAELHAAGALTSATLMANGAAFDDAVSVTKAHPTLGVGCHVVLVDGVPVSAPTDVTSLLGPDSKTFRHSLPNFDQAVLTGKATEADMLREATAQIERLQRAGITVTHLDTHKHTHMLPAVARVLVKAAERTGVRAIRNPFEPEWSRTRGRVGLVRRAQLGVLSLFRSRFDRLPLLRTGHIQTTKGTVGIAATGALNAATLREFLDAMPAGTWELVCHPGHHDADLDETTTRLRASRDVERQALLQTFAADSSHRNGLELIHYGDIRAPRETIL